MKIRTHSLLGALVVASASVTAGVQASAHQHVATKASALDSSVHAGMATSAHMRHTGPRAATAADSARARAIVDTLRQAIAKYAETSAAVAAGYRMFSPPLRFRPVYHFTSRNNAVVNESSFDPARPTSLLYERTRDGRMELVGAMYTAPRRLPKTSTLASH